MTPNLFRIMYTIPLGFVMLFILKADFPDEGLPVWLLRILYVLEHH